MNEVAPWWLIILVLILAVIAAIGIISTLINSIKEKLKR